MKAVVIEKPHFAKFLDQAEPQLREGYVLVRVQAVGICMSDVEILRGTRPEPYVKYPITPGHEWCGTVVELGSGVTRFKVADRVAVEGHNFCRTCFFCLRGETNLCETYNEFGFTLPGGYAQYVAVRADLAHPFAESLPYDYAALTEPGACAGHGILRAGVRPGDTVAIIGPGTIGLLGLAWAKLFSPRYLVAVSRSRKNEAVARAMGATHYFTLDDDPTSAVRELTNGRGADVVFEAAGNAVTIPLAIELARRGGTVVFEGIVGAGEKLALESDIFCLKDLRVHGIFAYASYHFEQTLRMIEAGLLNVGPLITHTFPLSDFARAFELLQRRDEPIVKVLLKP